MSYNKTTRTCIDMAKVKINIKLSKEEKFKIIKKYGRSSLGLPPSGKLIKAKKGGAYQRKTRYGKLIDE